MIMTSLLNMKELRKKEIKEKGERRIKKLRWLKLGRIGPGHGQWGVMGFGM